MIFAVGEKVRVTVGPGKTCRGLVMCVGSSDDVRATRGNYCCLCECQTRAEHDGLVSELPCTAGTCSSTHVALHAFI